MVFKENSCIGVLLGIVVLFTSYKDNKIYFDLSTQTVNTCDGEPIFSLFITKSDHQEYGSCYKLQGQKGTDSFKINAKPGYVFYPGSSGVAVFSFDPNSKFSIENKSVGDAASVEIEVETDSKGKVVSASITKRP